MSTNNPLYKCVDCEKEFPEAALKPILDVDFALSPLDKMPEGLCPECGAACLDQAERLPKDAEARSELMRCAWVRATIHVFEPTPEQVWAANQKEKAAALSAFSTRCTWKRVRKMTVKTS